MKKSLDTSCQDDKMYLAKTTDRLNEAVKRYPELAAYLSELQFVFFEFYKQDGRVIFLGHKKASIIQPELLRGKRVLNLHIGVLGRTDGLTVIWSAFHEWGHLKQPPQTEEIRTNPLLTYEREKEAWEIAERKLRQFEAIKPLLPRFEAYREICLKDYLDKII